MDQEAPLTTLTDQDAEACARCGALIAASGRQRHDAWHEFIESSITGLTADLASLGPR